MVHTAELSYTPIASSKQSLQRFLQCYNNFKKLPHVRYIEQRGTYELYDFKESGIGLIAAIEHDGIMRFVLRINFERLIEQQDRIKLYQPEDFLAVTNAFNELIDSLEIGLPHFYEWKVARIDYCVNIKTPYVTDYIRLLRTKSDLPPSMRNAQTSKREGSLYAYNGKAKQHSICINFYDKQSQLESEDAAQDVLDQAQDILRIEVQCLKPKTEYLKNKYSMTAKNIPYFLHPQVSYDTITGTLAQVTKDADYQRHTIARQMIDSSSLHNSTKQLLTQIVDDIAMQQQSVLKVRKRYVTEGIMSAADFARYLRKLEELNVNPVTISDNLKLGNKRTDEGLESIQSLINKHFAAVTQ